MTGLTRRATLGGLCSCTGLALAGCAPPAPAGRVGAGYKPDPATDEGGLWLTVEKAEGELKRSRALIRDPALTGYVQDLACRLAGDRCGDIRVYVTHVPQFNAQMMPNGAMQVWSGLLLRVRNEAQLAAVLGHEIGHYIERHSLQLFREKRATADAVAFLTVTGVGLIPAMAIAASGSIPAFSREAEREADEIGLMLMAQAGYDPMQAAEVWEQVIAEKQADPNAKEPSLFYSTHPAPAERVDSIRARAGTLNGGGVFAERYREKLKPLRTTLLQDELRLRQYERSLVVFDYLAKGMEDAEIVYFTGEVYRLRDKGDDRTRARAAYERAIAMADCPPEALRSLGLVHRAEGARSAADAAFRRYLERVPNAPDKDMIRSYLGSAG